MMKSKRFNSQRFIKNMGGMFSLVFTVLGFLTILWGIISWLEVVTQNLDMHTPTVLSAWNMFKIFIK